MTSADLRLKSPQPATPLDYPALSKAVFTDDVMLEIAPLMQ